MPFNGLLLFLPILLGKNPYFSSLPSVFIFSALFRKFLACKAYIGIFSHLHNLNKAISHIFHQIHFWLHVRPIAILHFLFLSRFLKLHRPYERHSTELFLQVFAYHFRQFLCCLSPVPISVFTWLSRIL